MSVLGPLFIPRKDLLAVPKVKDNPELEKFLTQLLQRVHTNELAIERWANSAPRVVYISGVGAAVTIDNVAGIVRLPLGVANASFPTLVDGSGNLVIPRTGWYTISMTVQFDTTGINPAAIGYITAEIFAILIPPFTLGSQIAGLSPVYYDPTTGGPGGLIPTVSATSIFNKGDLLAPAARSDVNFGGSAEPILANIQSLALRFEGDTPSSVQ